MENNIIQIEQQVAKIIIEQPLEKTKKIEVLTKIDNLAASIIEVGEPGRDGLSAYDLWLQQGNHGSPEQFLEENSTSWEKKEW